ncbi:MAG: ROK family protein [Chloroflexota bacterium]|nr:ROK family protein [Chloroflexota bacterium]
MTHALGIDFGGTKILAGVVDTETGKVLSEGKKRTHAELGSEEVLSRLVEAAREALEGSGIAREAVTVAGIGVAGQVSKDGRALDRAPNLPEELQGNTIVNAMQEKLQLPAMLFNDVVAAAAGEAAFGAGRDQPDFVCIFVGTGIGGGVYRDGKPYRGATNTAGELGHMVVDRDGRVCSCGGLGHLEAYASRTAIVRTILGALRLGRSSILAELAPNPDPENPRGSDIRSKALGRAVKSGDLVAIQAISDGARTMAAGLVSIINFYNPPRIILGGGLVQEVELFFDLAASLAREEALEVPSTAVEIVKAVLGDDSGVVGAAVLATGQ